LDRGQSNSWKQKVLLLLSGGSVLRISDRNLTWRRRQEIPRNVRRNTLYKVVQIWPGQTVTCLHAISPGHIWTTLYYTF
jgi:hypothetical protein